MKAREHVDHAVRRRAIQAALGKEPFDILLAGGTVLDVSTGQLRASDVGIVGPLIASVHPRGSRADAAETVDCTGQTITPGLIDAHLHFETSMLTPSGFSEVLLPHGTTTVACDPHELANVSGVAGIRYALDAVQGQPVRFIVQASSCVPAVPGVELSGADLNADDLVEVLGWEGISGVGELMDYQGILEGSERMTPLMEAVLDSGHTLNGHAAGLSGPSLQAYLAAGVTSDHTMFTVEEFDDRLFSGMTVELVGLFVGPALEQVAQRLEEQPIFPTNVVLATDDLLAVQYLEDGGVDTVVRLLIEYGLAPAKAFRAATLNSALRLRREDLGLVAPGRLADLLLLDDLETVAIDRVMTSGRFVAERGRMLVTPPRESVEPDRASVKLGVFTPEDFALTLPADGSPARVATITGLMFSHWSEASVELRDGVVQVPEGHLLMAIVHRHGRREATPSFALIAGRGDWTGAMATTVSHDSHNLVVFGTDPAEMALAANTVVASDGGYAVVKGGEVSALIPLPLAGLMTGQDVPTTVALQKALQAAAAEIGMVADLFDPVFEFTLASLVAIPGPHLTDIGIVDGTTGEHFGPRPALL